MESQIHLKKIYFQNISEDRKSFVESDIIQQLNFSITFGAMVEYSDLS